MTERADSRLDLAFRMAALSARRHLHSTAFRAPSVAIAPLLLALALAGCASNPRNAPDPTITGAIAHPVSAADLVAAEAFWGERYAANQEDATTVLTYASILVRLDRVSQAIAVLQRGTINFPEDRAIMAAYGKALATAGAFSEALTIIRRAQTPDRPDWTLLAAEAAILDQTGDNGQARVLYQQAIDLAPGQASLWSNLGMSYVLTGELEIAEANLRRAVALPTADSRVRQNLALVLGLQGRFDEAEAIARQELTAAQAEANMAYLRAMLSSQDPWTQLRETGGV